MTRRLTGVIRLSWVTTDQTDDKTCARDARLLAHLIKYTYILLEWNVDLANTGKKITKTAKIYGYVVLKGDRTIV